MGNLRAIPKVDVLAAVPGLASYPERTRVLAARQTVAEGRRIIQAGGEVADWDSMVIAFAAALRRPAISHAINGTGVILHTGLGRARLAVEAAEAVDAVARGHATLEIDRETGQRGDRQLAVRDRLCRLTGAEDAVVVNNNAAAVILALASLAKGKQVILSRGQMVEIGGSFRLPDIVVESGCHLVEVGCTNKTRLADFDKALTGETAAVLRCHPSNFKVTGFQEEPTSLELASWCKKHRVALIDDVGSGCLIDLEPFGLSHERTLREAVADGPDLITASGDKLLGGPQAGILLGKRKAIAKVRKHPLARALRIDKLDLAALEATLRLYEEGREMEIPTLSALGVSVDSCRQAAQQMAGAYGGEVVESITEVGGGSMPGEGIPTVVASLSAKRPGELLKALRMGDPPIFGRIERNRVLLDPRTMTADEVEAVALRLQELRG